MRLLLLVLLCLVLYYLLRSLAGGRRPPTGRQGPGMRRPPPLKDELVKDPVCGVYCPKSQSHRLRQGGETFHFCSRECLKEFQRQHRTGPKDR